MRKILVLILLLLFATPAIAGNVTKVEIHGIVYDEKSSIYNSTLIWDAQKFPAFWYALGSGKSSETLKIDQPASTLTASSRTIEKEKLTYSTFRTDQKYVVFTEKGKKVDNALEYDNVTKTFTKSSKGGYYARLGWFGDIYIATNGKANKLSKLVIEQKKDEKKTLKIGESWNLGEGFNITAESIDTKTSPRQAWLRLSKNDDILDEKIVNEGDVYTYTAKDLQGESSVPIFVTYIDSVFMGEGMAVFVQLRYTWLISNNVIEIKTDDTFGTLKVRESTEDSLLLYNENPINLAQNSVQPLYNDFKIRVADSATALRFYPIAEYNMLNTNVQTSVPTAIETPKPIAIETPKPIVTKIQEESPKNIPSTITDTKVNKEQPTQVEKTPGLSFYVALITTLTAVSYLKYKKR